MNMLYFTAIVCMMAATVSGYCLYGNTPDCYFQCHCSDKSECSTGRCSSCDRGPTVLNTPWQGDTCQTGNVALYKTATQPGDGWPASQALDGATRPDEARCAHPGANAEGLAELVVDLGHIHRVTRIAIYNRNQCCEQRLTGFQILLRNDTSLPEVLCVQSNSSVRRSGRIDLNCDQPVSGRYVRFVRLRGSPQAHVSTLCEFIIVGHRVIDCSQCPSAACNDVSGCERCVGTYQPDCETVCEDGYYGDNCALECGMCDFASNCGKTNGVCSNGCQLWYINDKCDRNIVLPVVNDEKQQKAAVATDNSLDVTWQPLTSIPEDLSEYYGYTVYYRKVNVQNLTEGPSVPHSTSSGKALIEGLLYNTEYELQITPYREMGDQRQFGSQTYPLEAYRTKCGIPEKPPAPIVTVTDIGSDGSFQALITMTPASQLNPKCDSLTDVIIEYKASSQQDFIQLPTDTSTINVTIPGLVDEEYNLRISVSNNEGLSATSELVKFTKPGKKGEVNLVVIIVPVVVGVLVIVAVILAVLFVLRRRKQTKKRPTSNENLTNGVADNNLYSEVQTIEKENKAFDYQASPKIPQKKLTPADKELSSSRTSLRQPMPIPRSKEPVTKAKDPVAKIRDADMSDDELSVASDPDPDIQDPEENIYVNSAVAVKNFESYVSRKKTNMDEFAKEYRSLPKEDLERCKLAVTPANKDKNRFLNIYPYDDTRVILDDNDGIGKGDYINANYITGYNRTKEYIATQGPRGQTVLDFWRLVWQEKVNRIVMVANVSEMGKVRCHQYWPKNSSSTEQWGSFVISLEAEEKCADYVTRILSVSNGKDSRTIRQFHFTSWEDKNKPLFGATTLLTFHRKVHSFDKISRDPMLIHCSAGVGRTGTFIALDILLQQARQEKCVDVFSWVQKLRADRMFMVQTKEQYFFLHDALMESIKCGQTGYNCNGLETILTSLCKSTNGELSELEEQFELLLSFKTEPSDPNRDGLSDINRNKNRNLDIVPDDRDRLYLDGKETYINAILVDSFKAHNAYIVTQMPLPNTVSHFWRLVCQHKCHTIIMLNQLPPDQTCLPYWPNKEGESIQFGNTDVRLDKVNQDHSVKTITTREFTVTETYGKNENNKTVYKVRHYQLLSWPSGSELPPAPGDVLDLLDVVDQWHQHNVALTSKGATLVHCLDGGRASGLYCAISHTLDRMKVEQEVDAFLAARYVVRSRPQFISSLTQYKFLYEIAREYMSRYTEYANFQ